MYADKVSGARVNHVTLAVDRGLPWQSALESK